MKLYVVVWEKVPRGVYRLVAGMCVFLFLPSTPVYVLSRYIARENEA